MQAWKVGFSETGDIALIELDIPDDATRLLYGWDSLSCPTSGKCDFADVISITAMDSTDGAHKVEKAYSAYDFNFIYKVGARVYADRFVEDPFDECTPGIHYFHIKGAAAAFAWIGWFRTKQHEFWAKLQSQSLEEYKKHEEIKRAEEKTQFMKELCDSLRESFGEDNGSTS